MPQTSLNLTEIIPNPERTFNIPPTLRINPGVERRGLRTYSSGASDKCALQYGY